MILRIVVVVVVVVVVVNRKNCYADVGNELGSPDGGGDEGKKGSSFFFS